LTASRSISTSLGGLSCIERRMRTESYDSRAVPALSEELRARDDISEFRISPTGD